MTIVHRSIPVLAVIVHQQLCVPSATYNSRRLADLIPVNNKHGQLTEWHLVLSSGPEGKGGRGDYGVSQRESACRACVRACVRACLFLQYVQSVCRSIHTGSWWNRVTESVGDQTAVQHDDVEKRDSLPALAEVGLYTAICELNATVRHAHSCTLVSCPHGKVNKFNLKHLCECQCATVTNGRRARHSFFIPLYRCWRRRGNSRIRRIRLRHRLPRDLAAPASPLSLVYYA
jgi:hypothetical protein